MFVMVTNKTLSLSLSLSLFLRLSYYVACFYNGQGGYLCVYVGSSTLEEDLSGSLPARSLYVVAAAADIH